MEYQNNFSSNVLKYENKASSPTRKRILIEKSELDAYSDCAIVMLPDVLPTW